MRFNQPSIYLTTYKNKRYVGKTNGRGNDYYGSGVRIKNIKDKTKLKVKLLETTTLDKLNEREIFWIAKLKPELNYTSGGDGGDTSASFTKEGALSKSKKMKAMKRSKEWCDRISKAKQGSKHSEEVKLKMSKAKLGKKPEAAIKASIKVRKTKAYREMMSKALKKAWAEGRVR